MTAARTLLQIAALCACFAGQTHLTGDLDVNGIRRALKTISGQAFQTTVLDVEQMKATTEHAA
jgi:hypothetical protein